MSYTEQCAVSLLIPTYVVILYFLLYLSAFIFVSITAFRDQNNQQWNAQENYLSKLKEWCNDCWHRRQCYLEVFPHLFDQCTDATVVVQFYMLSQSNDTKFCGGLSMRAFFWVSLLIIGAYRAISSALVGYQTHTVAYAVLQFCDFELIRALYVNFKTKTKTPNVAQTWIMVLEATFESAPQFVLQLVFTAGTNVFQFWVLFSICWSLFTVIWRTTSDDLLMPIKNIKKSSLRAYRFFDITSRLVSLSLLWIIFNGYVLATVFGIECGVLIMVILWRKDTLQTKPHFVAFCKQNYELLHAILKAHFPYNLYVFRTAETSIIVFIETISLFGLAQSYNSLNAGLCSFAIVTCFGNILCCFTLRFKLNYELKKYEESHPGIGAHELYINNFNTSRNVEKLIQVKNWKAVREMIEYGIQPDWIQILKEHIKQMITNDEGKLILEELIRKDLIDGQTEIFSPPDIQKLWSYIFDIIFDDNELSDECIAFAVVLHRHRGDDLNSNLSLSKGNILSESMKQKNEKTLHFMLSLNDVDIASGDNESPLHTAIHTKNIDDQAIFVDVLIEHHHPDVSVDQCAMIIQQELIQQQLPYRVVSKLLECQTIDLEGVFIDAVIQLVQQNNKNQQKSQEYLVSLIEAIMTKEHDTNEGKQVENGDQRVKLVDRLLYFDKEQRKLTALHYVISNYNQNWGRNFETLSMQLIRLLVSDVNINQVINKQTALMMAVQAQWGECVHLLLQHKSIQINDINDISDVLIAAIDLHWAECVLFIVKNYPQSLSTMTHDKSLFMHYKQQNKLKILRENFVDICADNDIAVAFHPNDVVEALELPKPQHKFNWMKHNINSRNINEIPDVQSLLINALDSYQHLSIEYLISNKIRLVTGKYNENIIVWFKKKLIADNKQKRSSSSSPNRLLILLLYCIYYVRAIVVPEIEMLYILSFLIINYTSYKEHVHIGINHSQLLSKMLLFIEENIRFISDSIDNPIEHSSIDTKYSMYERHGGNTLLMTAVKQHWKRCIKVLLENGGENVLKINNQSLLLFYCRYSKWDEMKILLANIKASEFIQLGTMVDLSEKAHNKTAYQFAKDAKQNEIAWEIKPGLFG